MMNIPLENWLLVSCLFSVMILVSSCTDQDTIEQPTVSTHIVYANNYNFQPGTSLTLAQDNTLFVGTRQLSATGELLGEATVGNLYNWTDVNEYFSFRTAIAFSPFGELVTAYRTQVIYPWDDVVFGRTFIAKEKLPNPEVIYAAPTGSWFSPTFAVITIDKTGKLYGVINESWEAQGSSINVFTDLTTYSTLVGDDLGYVDSENDFGVSPRFREITDIQADPDNNLIVADPKNNCIRKVTPQGFVSTVAGTDRQGYTDGPAKDARFRYPSGIAVDKQGNIFVADSENHCIRKISKDGKVSTVAGKAGEQGYKDGHTDAARFSTPINVAIGANGELYVLDSGNKCIRIIK